MRRIAHLWPYLSKERQRHLKAWKKLPCLERLRLTASQDCRLSIFRLENDLLEIRIGLKHILLKLPHLLPLNVVRVLQAKRTKADTFLSDAKEQLIDLIYIYIHYSYYEKNNSSITTYL